MFEKWARNYVRRNYWRVASVIGDEDDALQECALIFSRCLKHFYKRGNPSHASLMALFKLAVQRDWITMAHKETLRRDARCFFLDNQTDHNLGYLSCLLLDGSPQMRRALMILADAPPDLLQNIFAYKHGAGDLGIHASKKLLDAAGYNSCDVDVLHELRATLLGTPRCRPLPSTMQKDRAIAA